MHSGGGTTVGRPQASPEKKRPFFCWLRAQAHLHTVALHSRYQYDFALDRLDFSPDLLVLHHVPSLRDSDELIDASLSDATPVGGGFSPDQREGPVRYLLLAIRTILGLLSCGLAGLTAYLLLLTGAAVLARIRRRGGPPDADQHRRFAILVPAHDEESTIGRLLQSTDALEYPATRFDVYVVADNCSDRTAEVARTAGAQVEERTDQVSRGKGYALRWLLARLRERGARYDAYVVIDADTVVAPDLLRRMDAHFEAGSQVVQVYYTVLNVGESPVAALRYAALAAVHYLRPLGRAQLGLSCGLKGNGMGFLATVLDQYGWEWFTLAEDVEFHLALVEAGLKVDFIPETTVLADMPVTYAQAESQNERWERGRLEMARSRGRSLLLDGLRQRDPVRVDAVIEQLVPPLSVPVLVSGAALAASLLFRARLGALLAAFSLGGQIGYIIAALALVGAPWRVHRALAYAPGYIGWKVWLYGRSLVARGSSPWVRTARTPVRRAAPETGPS